MSIVGFGLFILGFFWWCITLLLKAIPVSSYAKNYSWLLLLSPVLVLMAIVIAFLVGAFGLVAILAMAMSVW